MFGIEGTDGFARAVSQALDGEQMFWKGASVETSPQAQAWSLLCHRSGFRHECHGVSRVLVLPKEALVS